MAVNVIKLGLLGACSVTVVATAAILHSRPPRGGRAPDSPTACNPAARPAASTSDTRQDASPDDCELPGLTDDTATSKGGYGGSGGSSNGGNGSTTTGRQSRVKNGDYKARVVGFYRGAGVASVNNQCVNIRITVEAADGRKGELVLNNLPATGAYFTGSGTMLGQSVKLDGRVDAARASRLVATFTVADGRTGRLVANLPADVDAGNDNWENPDAPASGDPAPPGGPRQKPGN